MAFNEAAALATVMYLLCLGTSVVTILSAIERRWDVAVPLFILTVTLGGFMGGVS